MPMTERIASRVGDLDADLQMHGVAPALPDIIIAATAIEHDYDLATHNLEHFRRTPKLRLVSRVWP